MARLGIGGPSGAPRPARAEEWTARTPELERPGVIGSTLDPSIPSTTTSDARPAPHVTGAPEPAPGSGPTGLARIAHLAGTLPARVAGVLIAADLVMTGCAPLQPHPAMLPNISVRGRALDEVNERALVERNRPSQLLWVNEGRGAITRITVHGIHAAPATLQPVVDRAIGEGSKVGTFAYDDRFRRLDDSARDLARELGTWLRAHPNEPLAIDAHSMGGRVTLAALAALAEQGLLDGRTVELNLVAPPLGGYASANLARTAPGFLAGVIDGLRPGIDMGTSSDFQRRLEAIQLPPGVKTTIWIGDRDRIVDASMPAFGHIAERLGARIVHVDGADHDSIIDRFAAR